MIASLTLVLVVVHLPLEPEPPATGWHRVDRPEQDLIALRDVRSGADAGVPITQFTEVDTEAEDSEGDRTLDEAYVPEDAPVGDQPRRIPGLAVMTTAPQMPEIVGGLGALYVHIEYPEEAVRNQIEGRLVLSFIVDENGETNDVRVIESLHPACDSAAVAALRRTQFVPGRSGGEPVAVRMRLPVRFRLVSSR